MPGRLLNESEFLACFAPPMRDVTATAVTTVDIWSYVDALPLSDLALDRLGDVGQVYQDGKERFDHVLIKTDRADVFLVVVIDIRTSEIVGHHVLDLPRLYGLDAGAEGR